MGVVNCSGDIGQKLVGKSQGCHLRQNSSFVQGMESITCSGTELVIM